MNGYIHTDIINEDKKLYNMTIIGIPPAETKELMEITIFLLSLPMDSKLSIFIGANGGSMSLQSILSNAQKLKRINITTIYINNCNSTAADIFLLGAHRCMPSDGFLLVHKPTVSSGTNNIGGHSRAIEHGELLGAKAGELMSRHFDKDSEVISRYNSGLDVYLNFKTCVEHGIVTHVITDKGNIPIGKYVHEEEDNHTTVKYIEGAIVTEVNNKVFCKDSDKLFDFIANVTKNDSGDMTIKFKGDSINVSIDGVFDGRYEEGMVIIKESGRIELRGRHITSISILGNSVENVHIIKNDEQTDANNMFMFNKNMTQLSMDEGTFLKTGRNFTGMITGCSNLDYESLAVVAKLVTSE